jgi:hypothetical protein
MHFHSLIKQRYVRRWFSRTSTDWRNSITGLLVGLMTLTAGISANFVYQSVWLSLIILLALMMGYVSIYARMVRYKWCSPVNFLLVKPMVGISR